VDDLVSDNEMLLSSAFENVSKQTLSTGYISGTALKEIIRRIKECKDSNYIYCIDNDNGLVYKIDKNCKCVKNMYDMNVEKIVQANQPLSPEQAIKVLKKKIKYCNNLLEKKMLEKQLNEVYKIKKRKKTDV